MASHSTDQTLRRKSPHNEEIVLKVRRELLRLGCRHNEISVTKKESALKFVYGERSLLANPLEAQATLKGMRQPVQTNDIWAILCIRNHKW